MVTNRREEEKYMCKIIVHIQWSLDKCSELSLPRTVESIQMLTGYSEEIILEAAEILFEREFQAENKRMAAY